MDNRKGCNLMKRVAAAVCALVLAAGTCLLCIPAFAEEASAETAGETFIVRVQYFGEWGDKIREKARFSRDELEAMGAQDWYYSNITRVGTVMSMAAHGPEVLTILQNAGIDLNSVSQITFRTTDGYTRNFTIPQHLSGGRLYYPNLSSNYQRGDDYETLIPLEGALEGGYEVPAILALAFGATKSPGAHAEELSMGTELTYRFCMGQTPLMEGVQTRPGFDGGDVSSMDSVHSIYGVDVTLAGYPIEGIHLDLSDKDLKVGSKKKVSLIIEGDELFADDLEEMLGDLTWSSSDESVAKVDQNGNILITGEGTVTITVTAANGMSASITLNGKAAGGQDQTKPTKKPPAEDPSDEATTEPTAPTTETEKPTSPTSETTTMPTSTAKPTTTAQATRASSASAQGPKEVKPMKTITMREISLGDEIIPETSPKDEERQDSMADDAQALDEAETIDFGVAAGTGAGALLVSGVGAALRIRRFHRDLR